MYLGVEKVEIHKVPRIDWGDLKMFFADNCEQYAYTKIAVPITLQKSPSDYDDMTYFLDVNSDDFFQENCYIGTHKLEALKLSRVRKADCEHNHTAEWKLEIIVNGGKSEEEVITILDELCIAFSLKFVRYYKYIQHCGFEGFFYDRMHMERKYAFEDKVFGDDAFSVYCGMVQVKSVSSIDNKVFELPKKCKIKSEYSNRLTSAFLEALKCKDKISRYILLYYLFEIMYETPEYQTLKNTFKSESGKMNNDKKRSKILFQYLLQEFGLKEYSSIGKTVMLEAETLEKIILTRNDLTHRGDLSRISSLMYNHLLPILREVIINL